MHWVHVWVPPAYLRSGCGCFHTVPLASAEVSSSQMPSLTTLRKVATLPHHSLHHLKTHYLLRGAPLSLDPVFSCEWQERGR